MRHGVAAFFLETAPSTSTSRSAPISLKIGWVRVVGFGQVRESQVVRFVWNVALTEFETDKGPRAAPLHPLSYGLTSRSDPTSWLSSTRHAAGSKSPSRSEPMATRCNVTT